MKRFSRFIHQPVRPLGPGGKLITGCAAHRRLAMDIAAEGTVLLKNDGTLPLSTGAKICPFGRSLGDFLFGGGGSGWVVTDNTVSLGDALRRANDQGVFQIFTPLIDYYEANTAFKINDVKSMGDELYKEPAMWVTPLPEELYRKAKEFGGIALLGISRYSTESNIYDRTGQEGDFLLWPEEQMLFDRLCADFEKVIVILNVCGPVATKQFRDNPKVAAILYPMFGGTESGQVLCDLLSGKRYPSGHLQDTLADRIEDYPSTANFAQHIDHVDYEEDIFVGYRYFETFAPEKAVYPYGFGLGYTTFDIACESTSFQKQTVRLTAVVKNTGNRPGKEVVQVYLAAPQGKLGKAAKVLTAFQKTKELLPGETCKLELQFNLYDFASFDDTGAICRSAFVLEAGEYVVYLGNNVRDCQRALEFNLAQDIICRHCHSYMAPEKLEKRLTASGSYAPLPTPVPHKQPAPKYKTKAAPETLTLDEALKQDKLDALLASMTNSQLGDLLYGHPMMNSSGTSGIGASIRNRRPDPQIPLVPTADGPAGYRACQDIGVNTTFFPCANVLAQTWEPKLAEKMGKAGALEIKENNIGIWLAPALNIHRNPMCGRNFEYYSEDPLISGVFAAAFVKGVQSQNIAATVKHFCCNNRETNRRDADSRVSERALREIYLRGFEIVVKKASPWALMTSYNPLNGQRSSSNWDAISGILRGEWKYKGLVMTDWSCYSTLDEEVLAGSHVKMPTSITNGWDGTLYDFDEAVAQGKLTRENLLSAAKTVMELLAHLE